MTRTSCILFAMVLAVACLAFGARPWAFSPALAQEPEEAVLESKGYLIPITRVQVTPRVSGQVIELFFEEGTRVEKDAVLARIDPTPYEFDYRRAEALLAAARARFDEVKAGPPSVRLEVAKAELAVAEVELAKAKWLLDGTQVRAPIGGTILSKLAEKGNTINHASFNLKGSFCDMADLTRMEVDVTVQERDFRKVFKGQKCKIQLEAFPETIYKGEVSRLLPLADRAKGAIPVRVRIDVSKDETRLRPDMGAIVSFLGKSAS